MEKWSACQGAVGPFLEIGVGVQGLSKCVVGPDVRRAVLFGGNLTNIHADIAFTGT